MQESLLRLFLSSCNASLWTSDTPLLVWNLCRNTIGYKEFFPYFEQTAALDACTEKLKQASRNYAKRQLTWFRHMDGVTWLDAGAADVRQTALRLTQDFLLKG